MAFLKVIILLLPALVHAQNDTGTLTSKTADKVGWMSAPDVRGTSDILWSCFAIFLVCTWKCTHSNIPSWEESEAGWHSIGNRLPYWPTKLWWRVFLRKVKWMVTISLAPELGVTMAVNELWQAWELRKEVSCSNFTLTHAFYALMGGFVIAIPCKTGAETHATDSESPKLKYYSIIANKPNPVEAWEKYKNVHSVVLSEIFSSINRESRDPSAFPVVTEAAINNQSKSDPFTKAFAVLQCTWLILQSIARTSQGLRLTELELATLAFTMCAFFMYGFWWYKPFDAQQSIPLLCLHPRTQQRIRSELKQWAPTVREDDLDSSTLYQFLGASFGLLIPTAQRNPLVPRAIMFQSLIFHITAIAFSGIHVIAWNWDFPSQTSKTLWRVFSIIATGGALALTILILIGVGADELIKVVIGERHAERTDTVLGLAMLFIFVSYVASRVGLIGLVFYSFSAMPTSVYQSPNWNLVFPHFS